MPDRRSCGNERARMARGVPRIGRRRGRARDGRAAARAGLPAALPRRVRAGDRRHRPSRCEPEPPGCSSGTGAWCRGTRRPNCSGRRARCRMRRPKSPSTGGSGRIPASSCTRTSLAPDETDILRRGAGHDRPAHRVRPRSPARPGRCRGGGRPAGQPPPASTRACCCTCWSGITGRAATRGAGGAGLHRPSVRLGAGDTAADAAGAGRVATAGGPVAGSGSGRPHARSGWTSPTPTRCSASSTKAPTTPSPTRS